MREALELLRGLAVILMTSDARVERIVETLEGGEDGEEDQP